MDCKLTAVSITFQLPKVRQTLKGRWEATKEPQGGHDDFCLALALTNQVDSIVYLQEN